jgi:Flp pilus assembly pilin Flp
MKHSTFLSSRSRRAVRGQTLTEYALILAIISVLAIALMLQLTGNVKQIYCNIDSQVSRSGTGS